MARFHLNFSLHLLPVTQATRSCFDYSPHNSSGMVFLYTFHKQLTPNVVLSACSVYHTVSVIATLISDSTSLSHFYKHTTLLKKNQYAIFLNFRTFIHNHIFSWQTNNTFIIYLKLLENSNFP